MATKKPDILRFIKDKNLINDPEMSYNQELALKAIYGLPLTRYGRMAVRRFTGRDEFFSVPFNEATFICGRRSGKSNKLSSNIAIYEAICGGYEKYLTKGEKGYVVVIAQNLKGAQVVFSYIKEKLLSSPLLSKFVIQTKQSEIELNNGIIIATYPCNNRSVRGLSIICCICDEVGFWRSDETGANPDFEILHAIRPGMATFPGAKLIKISTPYIKQGILWDDFNNRKDRQYCLIWNSPTWDMNPAISKEFYESERARDELAFRREYGAEFTDSISAYIPSEFIAECVKENCARIPYNSKYHYKAAIDPAFKHDTFTLGICHKAEGSKVVLDCLEGWKGTKLKPVQLETVVSEISQILKQYHIGRIAGDQFCSEPVRQEFAKAGFYFEEIHFNPTTKIEIYENLRTLVVNYRIELLDHKKMLSELRSLEKRILPSRVVQIGHPEYGGYSDDYATVVAVAAFKASEGMFISPEIAKPKMTPMMAGYVIERAEQARMLMDNILGSEYMTPEEIEEEIFNGEFREQGWVN